MGLPKDRTSRCNKIHDVCITSMKTIAELRSEQYEYIAKIYPCVFEWSKYPYTCFKTHLYMEASAVLVYLLLKTKIKPNTVSILYIATGILGGILLAVPTKLAIFSAVVLLFFREILDWSDGHYARVTKQTSITGDILDAYGTRAGWISLWVGLGLNVAYKSGTMLFYYLVPLIPALWAGDIWSLAIVQLFNEHLSKDRFQEGIRKDKEMLSVSENAQRTIPIAGRRGEFARKVVEVAKKMYRIIFRVFDQRSRLVDLICVILLIEMFSDVFISWFVFLAFLAWQLVVFVVKFYTVAQGRTIETQLQKKIEEISQAFRSQA